MVEVPFIDQYISKTILSVKIPPNNGDNESIDGKEPSVKPISTLLKQFCQGFVGVQVMLFLWL